MTRQLKSIKGIHLRHQSRSGELHQISRKSLQNLSFFLPSQTLLLCFLSFSLILPLFLTINRNLNDAFKSLST